MMSADAPGSRSQGFPPPPPLDAPGLGGPPASGLDGPPAWQAETPARARWMDFLWTAAALLSAWALIFGATHWVWWALAWVSAGGLAVLLFRKLARIHREAGARELPLGKRQRPAGTPSGRKLSEAYRDAPEP